MPGRRTRPLAILIIGLVTLGSQVLAEQYLNGWTDHTFARGVDGCIASAVPRQMQFMVSSGQLKADAAAAEVEAARTMVTGFETTVCTCAQHQIMQDVQFSQVQQLRHKPDYVRQIMTTCSDEALRALH